MYLRLMCQNIRKVPCHIFFQSFRFTPSLFMLCFSSMTFLCKLHCLFLCSFLFQISAWENIFKSLCNCVLLQKLSKWCDLFTMNNNFKEFSYIKLHALTTLLLFLYFLKNFPEFKFLHVGIFCPFPCPNSGSKIRGLL